MKKIYVLLSYFDEHREPSKVEAFTTLKKVKECKTNYLWQNSSGISRFDKVEIKECTLWNNKVVL